ncbi:MAG TPA: hypothetical protein VNR59_03420 [Gaiellaceae bacterium]|nr:hypothetical protein [Gaiellaceae bacterium]
MEENKEPTTTETEEVEGHGYVERPVNEDRDANTEEPDVEAHGFVEKPVDM